MFNTMLADKFHLNLSPKKRLKNEETTKKLIICQKKGNNLVNKQPNLGKIQDLKRKKLGNLDRFGTF